MNLLIADNVIYPGQNVNRRRILTPFGTIKPELRRRSAIEPVIGHMKAEGHLGHCYLKGTAGDAANANGRHDLIGMLRQSVFWRVAGYEDVNDADRLGRDPMMLTLSRSPIFPGDGLTGCTAAVR